MLILVAPDITPGIRISHVDLVVLLIVALFLGALLLYAVAAGMLAIKGRVAGVYVGLVEVVLSAGLSVIVLSAGDVVGGLFWLVPNVVILTLGVLAIARRGNKTRQVPQTSA